MADQDQAKKMTLVPGQAVKPKDASFEVPQDRERLCPMCGDPRCINSRLGYIVVW